MKVMGRAKKWLRGLFWMNKKETSNASFGNSLRRVNSRELICNPPNSPANITPVEDAWPTFHGDDKELYDQAIEVVAASLVVAEASVKAAEAADELVRLTKQRRGKMQLYCRRVSAAITIQSIFRGFLARKARRALKALVKVQALVRGFLVRKQSYATLHSLRALHRAQQNARALKTRFARFQSESYLEKFDDSRRVLKGTSRRSRSLSASFERNVTNLDECRHGFNGDETYSHATPPRQNPARLLFPERGSRDQWGYMMREHQNKNPTALLSPVYSCGSNSPISQERCAFGDDYYRDEDENCPNYMVNKRSSNAKMRSQSVPKQRIDELSGSRRRLSLNEFTVESKGCKKWTIMPTSACSYAQGSNNFRNIVMASMLKFSK